MQSHLYKLSCFEMRRTTVSRIKSVLQSWKFNVHEMLWVVHVQYEGIELRVDAFQMPPVRTVCIVCLRRQQPYCDNKHINTYVSVLFNVCVCVYSIWSGFAVLVFFSGEHPLFIWYRCSYKPCYISCRLMQICKSRHRAYYYSILDPIETGTIFCCSQFRDARRARFMCSAENPINLNGSRGNRC